MHHAARRRIRASDSNILAFSISFAVKQLEGLTISCIIGLYLNFSVKQFCLLTVNGKGRDLIGVHKFAQLQGVYVYAPRKNRVRLGLVLVIIHPYQF